MVKRVLTSLDILGFSEETPQSFGELFGVSNLNFNAKCWIAAFMTVILFGLITGLSIKF